MYSMLLVKRDRVAAFCHKLYLLVFLNGSTRNRPSHRSPSRDMLINPTLEMFEQIYKHFRILLNVSFILNYMFIPSARVQVIFLFLTT